MGSNQRRFRRATRNFCARNDPKSTTKKNAGKKWNKNQIRYDATHVRCARHVGMYEASGKRGILVKAGVCRSLKNLH